MVIKNILIKEDIKLKKLVQDRNFSFNFKIFYEEFNKKSNINYKQINRFLMRKKIEFDSLLPRMEVIDLIYYSKNLNKKIILISDTWYDKKFIIKILKNLKLIFLMKYIYLVKILNQNLMDLFTHM